jgi:hypothetical protein
MSLFPQREPKRTFQLSIQIQRRAGGLFEKQATPSRLPRSPSERPSKRSLSLQTGEAVASNHHTRRRNQEILPLFLAFARRFWIVRTVSTRLAVLEECGEGLFEV